VTPEDIKKILRIEMAVLKFDIAEILEEKISKALRKRYSEEDARRRESTW
jgi:hypothetical protein